MDNPILKKIFPFLLWLPQVNKKTLKIDFMAGVTGALIVLPQGVAFSLIAGLPPIYGLYTAMVTPIIAGLFGSSYHLISGPTTAISLVIYSSVSPLAIPGTGTFVELTLTLTFIAGFLQFLLGVVRMGTLVNFISHSVVVGFTSGAALLIATSQLKHITGLEMKTPDGFWETWGKILTHLGQSNLSSLGLAVATICVAALIVKQSPNFPYLLTALIVGSLLGLLFGSATGEIQTIGELPRQLPPLKVPSLDPALFQRLAPNAFAIALLGLIQTVAVARTIGFKSGQRIDGNQEFIGQGLSNLVGSFFSSFAGSGSFTRSGINFHAGARTPMAAIFSALLLMGLILLIAPLARYLPTSVVGGIILIVAYNLLEFDQIKRILKSSRSETAVMSITFFTAITMDLQFAIYFGVFFSLIFFLMRTSKPRVIPVAPNPRDSFRKFEFVGKRKLKECPQLKIVRLEGALFFGAVDHVVQEFEVLRQGGEKHLLIIGNAINMIDVSGAEMLVYEMGQWNKNGGGLYVSGLKNQIFEFLIRGKYLDRELRKNFFQDKKKAISEIFRYLNPHVCRECQVKIFAECKDMKATDVASSV